ncbi:MAG: SNF2-related protein [Parvularcula sp.]|jgi:superfamily II DNA or RNA helicase|nr:SNF2-related protein [Parvularcula sp.]
MLRFSPYHAQFLAHQITLEGSGDDAFAKSLSTARVDMNPHQVDAALFALRSPLVRGAILADEVGLGKTIEASLVIAQKWAERERRILLIVPASLRRQWAQELQEKFSLPSRVFDAKTYRDAQKAGERRPFDTTTAIIIVSYEFAAGKVDDLAVIDWDLVIYDEAHRLRNVYQKNGAKRAKALQAALQKPKKLLLTATPLQNSLMELYGLVSMIDERHFGDAKSFRSLYTGAGTSPAALAVLRQRLQPICRRTLRRQVQEAGHFNFTRRNARTFSFDPGADEARLYEGLSHYLQRKDTVAFGDKPNQLIVLTARKILGSSTFAIIQFLDKVIARLEEHQRVAVEDVEDVDTIDELADEFGDEEQASPDADDDKIDPAALAAEIELLRGYRDLAIAIGSNAKGDMLVRQLPGVLDEMESKGGRRKAVIFTESVRTQNYLNDLLSSNGYEGQIVLLNGSNNDPGSRQLYADWLAQNRGTDRVSGSKSADMKAAVVDAFRGEDRCILIATESGAEGINLQFCSLLINYDLPWNPQRVEQRIGRCHRYGQKIDVTVVNMLNLKNRAEARVHQLLDQKFQLFEGVFGASDEVLGSIERGIDFEKRILEIVQSARNAEEVDAAFDGLQEELAPYIAEDMANARQKLLDHMDQEIVAKLKTRKGDIEHTLDIFRQRLLTLARAELPEARFHSDDYHDVASQRFDHDGRTFTTEWPIADEQRWQFFRLTDDNLATTLVERAKSRALPTAQLTFDLNAYPMQLADVRRLAGQSGWLKVQKVTVQSRAEQEHLIVACVTDGGETVDPETAARLFLVPGEASALAEANAPDAALNTIAHGALTAILGDIERQNAEWLEEETEKLDAYADDLEQAAEAEIKELEAEIKAAKKALRAQTGMAMADKLTENRRIKRLEGDRDDKRLAIFERRRAIRAEIDAMLDEIAASLEARPVITDLFALRWSVLG